MELLRMEEAATKLGISYGQLRTLITKGQIQAIKIGARTIRIDNEEIEKHLKNRRITN